MSKLPWEPGFIPPVADQGLIGAVTKTVQTAESDVAQAVGAINQTAQIGSDVATTAASVAANAAATAAKAAAGAVQAAEGVAGAVAATPAPAPSVAPTVTPAGGIEGALLSDLEKVALDAAKQTTVGLLPGIEQAVQKRVAGAVQAELTDLLTKVQGGATPAVPNLTDFTKADARSRAIRTLLGGLALSILWGLTNVLGNIATVNWADRNALPQVITLAVASVVGAVGAYLGRVLKEPAHVTNATIIPGPTSKTS